jgi:hypothetical protein
MSRAVAALTRGPAAPDKGGASGRFPACVA